ncbi:MAG: SusC/RagA family TonB-linked outer membrane protein [Carboxylicivirga sp.]|jgi:TonB-linked SusC/RagA family outer membrane protein|nr:SusC/RagA family TonB-linked outer membrane protein [Carboxylicivirga sp.]
MKKNYGNACFSKNRAGNLLLKMKLIVVFLLIGYMQLYATAFSQNQKISINLKDVTVEHVLREIEENTEVNFLYQREQINVDRRVSVNAIDKTLGEVLDGLFHNTEVSYRLVDTHVILMCTELEKKTDHVRPVQINIVSGVVKDVTGEPLPGVTVMIKGTTRGTISGVDGTFSLKDVAAEDIIVFSFIGFETLEVKAAERSEINVTLVEDIHNINEVVVTALGIERNEKALGFSVQKVKGEEFTVAKGAHVATNMTGKVAGLLIQNSTEFGESPTIKLRGSKPLVVVDGVAYSNMDLSAISADDIASVDVLKGATAAALYGVRGRKGAIMVTLRKGSEMSDKISVNVSSNTMFQAGYIRMPERQTSYSSGQGGVFNNDDFVWGAYMNGQMEHQYNPVTKKYEDMPLLPRGENNLENFLENSFITNNNVSVSQTGKLGGFRVSGTQIHHKGDYPNTKEDKYIFNVGGNIDYNKLKIDASVNYSKQKAPNIPSRDYGSQNIIYNMMIWTGPEYDIRDYKDYWVRKDVEQSWQWASWYDNPYFLMHERLDAEDEDYLTGKLAISYDFFDKLSLTLRSGYDSYSRKYENQRAISTRGDLKGSYEIEYRRGNSLSNDFLLNSDITWKGFNFDLLGGLSTYYYEDEEIEASTKGGLSMPGFYSLKASAENPEVDREIKKKMVYGVYGKIGISYKSLAFLDVTGRNDWTSTLPKDSRSYFYPSISGSFIPSEIFNPFGNVLDYVKLRGSWAVAKKDLDVYDLNLVYEISTNKWDGLSTASYPGTLRDPKVKAETERTYELGIDLRLFKNRISLDVAYFNRLQYNRLVDADVSDVSGFEEITTNTEEEHVQKGMEFTLRGKAIVKQNFGWSVTANLAYNHWYYHKLDPKFSDKDPRIREGLRYDTYFLEDWERDHNGNLVLYNGFPRWNNHRSIMGEEDPDFFWGLTNNLNYKNFQLSFSFDGRVGGLMYNWTNQALWNTGAHPDSDNQWRFDEYALGKKNFAAPGVKVTSGEVKYDPYGEVISDTRVFAPNDVVVSYGQYTQEYHANAYSPRPQNMMDPTFIKLREVALNYTIPKNIARKFGMTNMQVGLIGQNLWLWSKNFKYSDPDREYESLNAPAKRYMGVNVNMTF